MSDVVVKPSFSSLVEIPAVTVKPSTEEGEKVATASAVEPVRPAPSLALSPVPAVPPLECANEIQSNAMNQKEETRAGN